MEFFFSSNVVCTVDIGCKLDLLQVALRLRNAEYNPRRFHAVVMRILEPRTAALIFRSGKIVVTGARRYYFTMYCAFNF